ncbi:hypothetical protein FHG87_009243 [Trinorchestia longiramus]|nr:hypothetical protein FHG87_009243 [Trinorchestia longiramus]
MRQGRGGMWGTSTGEFVRHVKLLGFWVWGGEVCGDGGGEVCGDSGGEVCGDGGGEVCGDGGGEVCGDGGGEVCGDGGGEVCGDGGENVVIVWVTIQCGVITDHIHEDINRPQP